MEKEAKKVFLERFAHFMAALTVFLKGLSMLDTPDKGAAAFLLMFLSLLFLALALFHGKIEQKIGPLKPVVFALEALVIGIIAFLYWEEGKTYLPYVYWAVFCAYAALAVFSFVKKPTRAV